MPIGSLPFAQSFEESVAEAEWWHSVGNLGVAVAVLGVLLLAGNAIVSAMRSRRSPAEDAKQPGDK